MNNPPPHQEDPPPARPRRRRGLWLLGTFLALGLVLSAILASGTPQAYLVRWAAQRLLETRVEVEGVSLVRGFGAATVRVYDVDADEPTLVLEDVAVQRDLLASDRIIPELRVGRLQVNLIAKSADESNIGFLRARLERPSGDPASMRYVPRRIFIEDVSLDAQLSRMGLRLDDLRIEANLAEADRYAVAITGEDIDGARWFEAGETHAIDNGSLDLVVKQSKESLSLILDANLPDLLVVAATADRREQASAQVWTIAIASAQAEGLALAGLEGLLVPVPVQFASLTVVDTQLQLVRGESLSIPKAVIDLRAQELDIGEAGDLWYGGDLAIKGAATWNAERRADVVVTFGHGQAATLAASGSAEAGAADVVIANWSRQDLMDTLPARYRAQADALPQFTGLSATLDATWAGPTYTVNVDSTSAAGSSGGDLRLSITGAGTRAEDGAPFAGTISVGIGKGTLNGSVRMPSRTALQAELALERVELNRWLQVVLGKNAPALPDATARGAVTAEAADLALGVRLHPQLELTGLTVGTREITDAAPLAAAGQIEWDRTQARLQGTALSFAVPDRIDLTLSSWQHDLNAKTGKAGAAAHVELGWLEIGELWGSVDVSGPVSYTAEGANASVTFTSGNMGWGDWAIPYGKTVEGAGKAALTYQGRRLAISDTRAALDDENVVQLAGGTVVLSPFSADLPLVVTTNLEPVIAMGLLESAEGTGAFDGSVRHTGEALILAGTARVDAAALALAGNRALFRGVRAETTVNYKGGFEGTGTATAAAATISNATIEEVSAPLSWKDDALRAPQIRGVLYGGRAEGSLRLGLLEQGRPLEAQLTFENVNLAQLSAALAPEDFQMTGLARGTARVALANGELTDIALEAQSDRGFTISREIVERVLKMPRFAESVGSRALNKILGPAPRRPFDRASLTLTLQDAGTLQGQALLESERTDAYRGLDLTVDLNVPVAGLGELMALAAAGD